MNAKLLATISAVALTAQLSTATEPADSIADHEISLQEVTVKAAPVIRKVDRDLFIPSADTKKRSSDGLDLLNNMQIPTLAVNTVMGKIVKGADNVEVRINGRQADINQVRALSPDNIIRIEYIENPGLRYDGAAAVLDFIVRNPNSGGAFSSQILQSLTNKFGNQYLNLKLNHGKSQWGISYNGHIRLDLSIYRENIEHYGLADGSSLNRIESPLEGKHNTYGPYLRAEYNYINTDTTNFYASLYFSRRTSDLMEYNSILSSDDGSGDVRIHDAQTTPQSSPGINLYFSQKIGHRQTLVFDVNASFYIGRSIRDYTETPVDAPHPTIDIDSRIRDRNFAITAEGDYIKEWQRSQLTAGMRYTANRNRSTYLTLDDAVYHQSKDRIYFFGEYLHRFGKLSLSAGIGGEYNNIHSREADSRVENLLFQPRATASYRFDDKSQLRLLFQSWTSTPSLSQMSPVRQEVDGLQATVGNPNLKPFNGYRTTLQYNYSGQRLMGQISAQYFRAPNAIMDYRYYDGNYIVTSYANQSGLTYYGISISPRVIVIPEWLTINGSFSISRKHSHGINYRHSLTDYTGFASISVSHWGVNLNAEYQHAWTSLWGETITKGETTSTVSLSYKYKDWQFATGMLIPFGHYSQGTETISRYAHIERTMRTKAIEQMPFISISYNVAWGRKQQGTTKLINNEAGVQSSSTAGK